MKTAAVFFNREGIIIIDSGHIKDPSQVVFLASTFPALKMLQQKGFMLFIVATSKCESPSENADIINNIIIERFKREYISISKIYCLRVETDVDSCYFNTNLNFFYQAAKEFNVNLSGSYFIGCQPKDIDCARTAGVTAIYLLCETGIKHYHELKPKPVIKANIMDAAKLIINQINKE